MIDKSIIKIICIFSFIIGGLTGLIPLIPFLMSAAFLITMFLTAPFVIIYLKHLRLIDSLSMEQSLFVSAISGFTSFLGFALIYFPIAFILNLIFKIESFMWIKVMFLNWGFIIPMVILIALLSALLNMFSGFLTVYFSQIINKKN